MPPPIPRQDRWGLIALGSHRHRPSLDSRRVGSCITRFGACSAFTCVAACILAKSPMATLCIGGFGSFVTSTAAPIATGRSDPSSRTGVSPAEDQRLFTAHAKVGLEKEAMMTIRNGPDESGDSENSKTAAPTAQRFSSTPSCPARRSIMRMTPLCLSRHDQARDATLARRDGQGVFRQRHNGRRSAARR